MPAIWISRLTDWRCLPRKLWRLIRFLPRQTRTIRPLARQQTALPVQRRRRPIFAPTADTRQSPIATAGHPNAGSGSRRRCDIRPSTGRVRCESPARRNRLRRSAGTRRPRLSRRFARGALRWLAVRRPAPAVKPCRRQWVGRLVLWRAAGPMTLRGAGQMPERALATERPGGSRSWGRGLAGRPLCWRRATGFGNLNNGGGLAS